MKIPKEVGGVEIPADVRRMAKRLVDRIDSPLGRDAAIAGLTLAAAGIIAVAGAAVRDDGDDTDAPEPPIPPEPAVPPVPPVPPEPPVRPTSSRPTPMPPITPAQAQAVADALGNVAQAALTRFLSNRR